MTLSRNCMYFVQSTWPCFRGKLMLLFDNKEKKSKSHLLIQHFSAEYPNLLALHIQDLPNKLYSTNQQIADSPGTMAIFKEFCPLTAKKILDDLQMHETTPWCQLKALRLVSNSFSILNPIILLIKNMHHLGLLVCFIWFFLFGHSCRGI